MRPSFPSLSALRMRCVDYESVSLARAFSCFVDLDGDLTYSCGTVGTAPEIREDMKRKANSDGGEEAGG